MGLDRGGSGSVSTAVTAPIRIQLARSPEVLQRTFGMNKIKIVIIEFGGVQIVWRKTGRWRYEKQPEQSICMQQRHNLFCLVSSCYVLKSFLKNQRLLINSLRNVSCITR